MWKCKHLTPEAFPSLDYQDLLSELESDMEDVWKIITYDLKTITESYLSHLVAYLKRVNLYLKFQVPSFQEGTWIYWLSKGLSIGAFQFKRKTKISNQIRIWDSTCDLLRMGAITTIRYHSVKLTQTSKMYGKVLLVMPSAKTITESYLSHLVACMKNVPLWYLCAFNFNSIF